jgi:hypothetical protein
VSQFNLGLEKLSFKGISSYGIKGNAVDVWKSLMFSGPP